MARVKGMTGIIQLFFFSQTHKSVYKKALKPLSILKWQLTELRINCAA